MFPIKFVAFLEASKESKLFLLQINPSNGIAVQKMIGEASGSTALRLKMLLKRESFRKKLLKTRFKEEDVQFCLYMIENYGKDYEVTIF